LKARFINPFINAAVYTLHQFFSDIAISPGSASVVPDLPERTGITAGLKFFGELDGRVIYFMEEDTCLKMVTELNETSLTELDELARDTFREMANIITGQSAIRLQAKKCSIDISTPSLHIGLPGEKWETDGQKIIHFPLHTGYGDLEIHLEFDN